MDREERLFVALSGRKPDSIPSVSILSDTHVLNQALGRREAGIIHFLQRPSVSRYIDDNAARLSRFAKLGVFGYVNTVLRANAALGFDGAMVTYWGGRILDHQLVEDDFGRVFRIVDDGFANPYLMYVGGSISGPEDWLSRGKPRIEDYSRTGARMYRFWKRLWGRKIAPIPFVAPGLWENSWQPFGFERFVMLLRKEPGFVGEMARYFTDLSVACVRAYADEGARVISFGDDLAYRSGPMVSPEILERYFGEGYRRITDEAHRRGAKIFIHCCGNTRQLLPYFVEWGFDGAHAFEPTAGNSLSEARRIVGDSLCLVGNIDVTKTLVEASKDEVFESVRLAAESAKGGGFILAPAHTHPRVSAKRVRWMLEAAEKFSKVK